MNYLNEANEYIKRVEIGKSIREANANRELVECYWNVGRLIVEAQGGKDKAKYGNELLKKWAEKLIKEYGKGYDYSNLRRFRQFFLEFPICGPLGHKLNWTIIRMILPIKDVNKRNYYINLCMDNNYFIDMLLYNYKYNCFVVVEIKCRKLKKEDKGQVEFYMELVDKYVKEPSNNPTIGIIITKEQDKFVANFVRSEKLIPLTYEIVNNI